MSDMEHMGHHGGHEKPKPAVHHETAHHEKHEGHRSSEGFMRKHRDFLRGSYAELTGKTILTGLAAGSVLAAAGVVFAPAAAVVLASPFVGGWMMGRDPKKGKGHGGHSKHTLH